MDVGRSSIEFDQYGWIKVVGYICEVVCGYPALRTTMQVLLFMLKEEKGYKIPFPFELRPLGPYSEEVANIMIKIGEKVSISPRGYREYNLDVEKFVCEAHDLFYSLPSFQQALLRHDISAILKMDFEGRLRLKTQVWESKQQSYEEGDATIFLEKTRNGFRHIRKEVKGNKIIYSEIRDGEAVPIKVIDLGEEIVRLLNASWKIAAYSLIANSHDDGIIPYKVAQKCQSDYGIRMNTVYNWIQRMSLLGYFEVKPVRPDSMVKYVRLSELGKRMYEEKVSSLIQTYGIKLS